MKKIFENIEPEWEGDNTYQGLQIISKYYDTLNEVIIFCSKHDILYSVDYDEIIQRGLTEEDATKLRKLNWNIDSSSNLLYTFV